MTLSFEPTNEDGSPRIFVGNHRPIFGDLTKRMRESGATIHQSALFGTCHSMSDLKRCYDAGEFDKPLYEMGD